MGSPTRKAIQYRLPTAFPGPRERAGHFRQPESGASGDEGESKRKHRRRDAVFQQVAQRCDVVGQDGILPPIVNRPPKMADDKKRSSDSYCCDAKKRSKKSSAALFTSCLTTT